MGSVEEAAALRASAALEVAVQLTEVDGAMQQDRLSGQNVAVGIRLADGARFLVFRTPVDEARMALTEVSAALDDRSLHSLLGDRSAEILGLFEVERTKIRGVIAEFDRQAAEQLRNRRN